MIFKNSVFPPHYPPYKVIINYQNWLPLTENWIYTQVKYLPTNIVPYIVCSSKSNIEFFSLPNIHCYNDYNILSRIKMFFSSLYNIGLLTRRKSSLISYIKNNYQTNLVHSHFGYTGYRYYKAVKNLGLKHIVTFYGVDATALPKTDPKWYKKYKFMFANVDQVLCEGPCMAKTISNLGCSEDKITVQHLGIRLDEIKFQQRQWNNCGPLKILIAGSFREKKGIPYALKALGLFAKEAEISVTIIGDAGKSPKSIMEKEKILSTIKEFQLQDKVRLLGYQPHSVLIEEAYKHHIFLSPSITATDGDTEGGAPITIIEMAATGMPVISTNHADIPEVIKHMKSGLLTEEKDANGITKYLRFLIDHPHLWSQFANNARAHIDSNFNAIRQGQKLSQIYIKTINQKTVP